ncbi:uncharacterized protein IL334_006971 [Kwoniella shivajii]|uniref:C2H2-type domain-containing protein n=1 Tax=Kwoniella shivajii TaxID=564305 RepID=A0ABZ1D7V7_9TREE|nr:hypothetical protein IL334_006971 [Kwoniella shivajii]
MLVSPHPSLPHHSLDAVLPALTARTIRVSSPVPGLNEAQEDFEEDEDQQPTASSSRASSLPACRTERRYKCLHPGCDKAYFKPSRLAEHELSHSGERPHKCPECAQSYLRASHLTAHMRTHLPAEARSFTCQKEGCGKSFWTATHLKRHEEMHERAEVYPCNQCDLLFPKAHSLREHVALSHMPEGTKPFPCPHEGCEVSFKLKAHLKAHEKTHDVNRYTCSHLSHGTEFPSFPVWSALQNHMHAAHPPICPHLECNGRVFKNAQRLKDHLKVHAEQALDKAALEVTNPEGQVPALITEGLSRRTRKRRISQLGTEDGGQSPKLVRVMSGEAGKDWWCDENDCEKRFKTKFALEAHRKAVHLALRPHICPIEGCEKSYPHKVNLTRHLATHSRPSTPSGRERDEGDVLVGKVKELRRFGCPAHSFDKFAGLPATQVNMIDVQPHSDVEDHEDDFVPEEDRCLMRFWRVYDVRRHLTSDHDIELDDMEVRRLLLCDGQTGE